MKSLIALSLAVLSLSACSKNYYDQGYMLKEESLTKLKVGQHSKQDVLQLLGSPSFQSSFDSNSWMYLSTTRYNKPLDQNVLDKRQLVVLEFSKENLLTNISRKTEDEGVNIKPSEQITEVKGHKPTVFEQLVDSATSGLDF